MNGLGLLRLTGYNESLRVKKHLNLTLKIDL
jgi:hypothetical protein